MRLKEGGAWGMTSALAPDVLGTDVGKCYLITTICSFLSCLLGDSREDQFHLPFGERKEYLIIHAPNQIQASRSFKDNAVVLPSTCPIDMKSEI